MSLFQKSVLNNYLNTINDDEINSGWEKIQDYQKMSSKVRDFKEEVFQAGFLTKIFVECLGYKSQYDSADEGNLFFEEKNISDSKKADGAIKKENEVILVIELKGTNTKNLKFVEAQAFGYKAHHPKCEYVVTSNFEKLRFYVENAVDCEEFDLFNLSKEDYKLLHLCLHKDSIFNGIPKKLKNESVLVEESITKKLYKDYSAFRNEIFNSLVETNSEYDKLLLFNKTQKLLDRFLFIFFAEDRNLVPANSISKIISKWEGDIAFGESRSLYSIFKQYFSVLNIGRPAKGEHESIFAFNGGLFANDEILDSIDIDDNILLKHTKNLSHYDFESEISVNILGHIFEHSLSEIEEIQNEISGLKTETSKRKKDGIFYTPKYITKYIVDNTVGKLCEEKKTELDIQEYEFEKKRKGRQKATLKKLVQKLEDYRKWLLQITICDPACGSGAFLNQALEFLIAEHQYIDELQAKLFGDAMVLSEVENAILENNIYGVDINEESVEIAKLSLWLRTAEKGRKLTSLNNNIKCGNSLIDDPTVAVDKAFDWKKEFPEVFEKGGFDVIIGNPPYVKARDNDDILGRNFIEKNYKSPYKMWDLYVPFIEKGIELTKENGLSAMIIPDTIGKSDYTKKLVNLIEENYFLYQIDFFPDIYVFQNVGVRSKITFIQKLKSTKPAKKVKRVQNVYDAIEVENKSKGEEQYLLNVAEFKINTEKCITLADLCYVSYGMRLNSDKSDPEKFKKTDLLSATKNEIHSKIYTEGKYLERYVITKDLYLEYNTERCPSRLVRPTFPELYPPSKLLLSRQKKVAVYTDKSHYCDNTIIMAIPAYELSSVNNNSIKKYYKNIKKDRVIVESNSESYKLKYLLAVINSKLISYHIKFESKGKIDFYPDDWKDLPIFQANSVEQNLLSKLSKTRIEQENLLQNISSNFIKLINSKFNISALSGKIENWHELEFGVLLKELEKLRKKSAKENATEYKKLSLSEEAEWMQYFNEQKEKAEVLKTEIDKTDKEIDQMVYELYGLTNEEIEIVENN